MLVELKKARDEKIQAAEQTRLYYKDNKADIRELAEALKDIPIQRASFDYASVDLGITGDYSVLKAVFAAFRKLGYEPGERPEKAEATFSTYFEHPAKEVRFWLSFSSTLCKRVKVGTKTQEVDIYEVVCE